MRHLLEQRHILTELALTSSIVVICLMHFIFDENGFKSILGTILEQLIKISMKPKLFNENYILIDDEDQYTVLIYDWRVLESESLQVNYDQTYIFIDFTDDVLKDTYLVQIQLVDDYNGNINHLISQRIRKHKWSKRF